MLVTAYGTDIVKTVRDALAASDIGLYLSAGDAVAVKPNLVVSRPASEGATTHPEVVEGIILFLKEFGVGSIKIIESAWVGDDTKRAYQVCGYERLSKRYDVPLIDLKDDAVTTRRHGEHTIEICSEALNTDFLINVPVLKAHCQTRMTCCMKNLKGCIPDSEKRRFHSLGLHRPIAALNALVKTGYCVVDGICGDLSFEEGGNPVEANRIIAGRNPLLVDSYCAELIGYVPDDIGYLTYGREMGLDGHDLQAPETVEINAQHKPVRTATASRTADTYRTMIDEDAACSACYASLIHALHRMGGRARMEGKISIGQGHKGKRGSGLGVGNCTRGFQTCVKGCPPKATDIIQAMTKTT